MLKKFGMVTVGVTAGLLAVAPMASASDHSDQDGNGNISCENSSGDRTGSEGGSGEGDGGLLDGGLIDVAGGGIGNDNTGNLISCNSILNGNAVSVGILGDAAAATDEG